MIADPDTPIAMLLSEDGARILGALLSELGARVVDAKVAQVRYVPGSTCVVQYDTVVDWSGSRSRETLVISFGVDVPGEALRVEADGFELVAWRYPRDPFLPGLEAAADRARVNKLLADLGSVQRSTNLRRRAYRPGRRAVIEAVAPSARLFVKVVRPQRAAAIQGRHEGLSHVDVIPTSHGWSEEMGLIVLEARKGKTLRSALESGARRFPSPADIVGLLQRVGSAPDASEKASSPVTSAPRHARLLATLAPEMRSILDHVVEATSSAANDEPVWTHGDFHSSQILVRGESITGLVDIDSSGLGQAADDLAGIVGHLSTVALVSARRKTVERYRDDLVNHFDGLSSPRALRLRTAAVILGLATGPFRVQRATWRHEMRDRVALAKEWVDLALEEA